MECRDAERLIEAYLDHELSEEAAEQVESHLSGCPACRDRYEAVLTLLRCPRPVSVPAGLRDRIVTAVATRAVPPDPTGASVESSSRWTRWTSAPWMAAAAALMLFFMGWLVSQFRGRPAESVPGHTEVYEFTVTVPPSPWVLSSWAQAMTLPGPGRPTALLVQGVAMDLLTRPSPDTTPVIRVRRPLIREAAWGDDEPVVPRIPFVLAGLPKLGV